MQMGSYCPNQRQNIDEFFNINHGKYFGGYSTFVNANYNREIHKNEQNSTNYNLVPCSINHKNLKQLEIKSQEIKYFTLTKFSTLTECRTGCLNLFAHKFQIRQFSTLHATHHIPLHWTHNELVLQCTWKVLKYLKYESNFNYHDMLTSLLLGISAWIQIRPFKKCSLANTNSHTSRAWRW